MDMGADPSLLYDPVAVMFNYFIISIPWIAPLYLYLIILSVKQVSIKYHFLSLWCDSTWDWTPVSKTIGKHSTH